MPREIYVPYGVPGLTTLYASIRRPSDGQRWYTVTPAWEVYNSAHVASGYAITLTEEGATGNYYADFPAGIIAAGVYDVVVRSQAGGSPAWPGDVVVGQGYIEWSGSSVVVPVAPDNASIAAIKAKTDNLTATPADETLLVTATNAIMARLGAPAGASISADIQTRSTYAGADTSGTATLLARIPGTIPANGSGFTSIGDARLANLDAAITSRAPASTALSTATWTNTKAGFIDAAISGISGGGGPVAMASGLVVAGSTGSAVVVSGLPSGKSYVGQHLYHATSGEARTIAAQSFASGNYTFSFTGTGGTEAGPFSSVSTGDVVCPVP